MGGRTFSRADIVGISLIALFSLWGLVLMFGHLGKGEMPPRGEENPDALVSRAIHLESSGRVQEALAYYKSAIDRRPSLCDPKSKDFLGKNFESKVNRWIRELKTGAIENRDEALRNAAYIFRKLNGGCG